MGRQKGEVLISPVFLISRQELSFLFPLAEAGRQKGWGRQSMAGSHANEGLCCPERLGFPARPPAKWKEEEGGWVGVSV